MYRENCRVVSNKKVAPGHFVVEFSSVQIAKKALPGQFVQVLCSETFEPLLPRPFSFLTVDKKSFSLLFHVVGKGTQILSKLQKGQSLWMTGPFGNGFSLGKKGQMKIMVGGGVGIPPLYHLSEYLIAKKINKAADIHVFLGARNKSLLLCEKEFKKLKINLHLSTNDGSKGFKGFVSQDLERFLKTEVDRKKLCYCVQTCGPNAMMKAVTDVCVRLDRECEISVEVPMACGFGACLGCAIKVHDDSSCGHRFAIACMEGPVFDGKKIQWES